MRRLARHRPEVGRAPFVAVIFSRDNARQVSVDSRFSSRADHRKKGEGESEKEREKKETRSRHRSFAEPITNVAKVTATIKPN